MLKMGVRICPSFWYQMAIFRVLAHGLTRSTSHAILRCLRMQGKSQTWEKTPVILLEDPAMHLSTISWLLLPAVCV